LWPGEFVCNVSGVPADSDYRQILRIFINAMVWSAVSIGAAILIMM
jgi:hypothetical protein